MATTLKVTPTLKGKDSRRFNAAIESSKLNKIYNAKKTKMLALVVRIMAKNLKTS